MQDLTELIRGVRGRGGTAILLVRHARTPWNRERRFLGRTDIPLDDEGRRQAAELGRRLPVAFTGLYASPLARARETASALGDPTVVPDLAELDQGHLEGLGGLDAISRFPDFFAHWARDPATAPTPGGETFGDLAARALGALEHIAGRHPGETVVVVTHQMVASALGCAASGEPLTAWREHRLPHVGIKLLARTDAGWSCLLRRIPVVDEVEDG